MRITLVISTLTIGGAQRVMSLMANYWAAQGHDVTLVSLSPQSDDWFPLHQLVTRVSLNLLSDSAHLGQALCQNALRVLRLRDQLRRLRPDVVISFMDTTNVLTILASRGLGIPVIISERTNPRRRAIGLAWSTMRSFLYRRADALVVQSSAVRDWAREIGVSARVDIIPNPINPEFNGSAKEAGRRRSGLTVVAMGRLVRTKGFDLLIEAFARCAGQHPEWSLVILGEGEERSNLELLIVAKGLQDRVQLAGQVPRPSQILGQADLFVLSSRFEGFPNALMEAMACKLAVISTDCPNGPRDIVRDGVDGLLIPPDDVNALAKGMDRLMANPVERQRLGAGAMEVVERFSLERIMSMWGELVAHTCRRGMCVDGYSRASKTAGARAIEEGVQAGDPKTCSGELGCDELVFEKGDTSRRP
jgi:GalNAc-alpha-(1->4)-GalNAc-alpha-(1->3)-diNAcBac-PP-undecaprenol alpha-1,4-N-acetyl-D-galactosaminyltransferase